MVLPDPGTPPFRYHPQSEAVSGYSPPDSRPTVFLFIAACVENSLFCRSQWAVVWRSP
jgi:hypothetical protein